MKTIEKVLDIITLILIGPTWLLCYTFIVSVKWLGQLLREISADMIRTLNWVLIELQLLLSWIRKRIEH